MPTQTKLKILLNVNKIHSLKITSTVRAWNVCKPCDIKLTILQCM